jgi:acid phosphatase type 7
VDVALVGHDHLYERFAPQDHSGAAEPYSIRQFVVGTGGRPCTPSPVPWRIARFATTNAHGVLKLTLHAATSYD